MTLEGLKIPGEIITVEGTNDVFDIFLFAISTCQWCRKGKQWLTDNDYKFSYIDIDKIDFDDKILLKKELRERFDSRVAFPFIVVNKTKHYVGFDDEAWKDLLKF